MKRGWRSGERGVGKALRGRGNDAVTQRPNQRWSMDFVADSIATGRRFRALAIVDDYSRECPVIEVDTSLGGARVVECAGEAS